MCCIEQFKLDCVRNLFRSLPRIGSIILVYLTQLLVKDGCISWAKALHFEPVSGTLYKLTERVLNCCIWSQKYWYWYWYWFFETHCKCAETLKMLTFDAIIFGGSSYKILTSAGTIPNPARITRALLESVYWAKRTSFEAVSLCLLCQFCLKLVLKSWLRNWLWSWILKEKDTVPWAVLKVVC